jgi:hypothetical protein
MLKVMISVPSSASSVLVALQNSARGGCRILINIILGGLSAWAEWCLSQNADWCKPDGVGLKQ